MNNKIKNKMIFPVLSGLALCIASTLTMADYPTDPAELGKSLTLFGAIQAGNAEGTIPAYTGGLTTPPAGHASGTGKLADPFADEKPLVRIDASNMAEYADQLSEGTKHLLQTRPDYYLNVYPTHRTTAYPQRVLDNTVRNATSGECVTEKNGEALSSACRGGIPFPIPRTGHEVMWNKLVAYSPPMYGDIINWIVTGDGNQIVSSKLATYGDLEGFYGDYRANTGAYKTYIANVTGPARKAGEAQGFEDFMDPLVNSRRAWGYTPGQRRIKMAPEYSYDTPHSQLGGALVYDEIFLFSGAMDRFEWKLVGMKEMLIPYNNYHTQFGCVAPELFQDTSMNPECERWELHRVWVVESTLKPGSRHIYSKRTFYFDEDNKQGGMYDAWDQSGKLYRSGFGYSFQVYEEGRIGPNMPSFTIYDFNKNMFSMTSAFDPEGNGFRYLEKGLSDNELQPSNIAGSGVR